MADNKYIRLFMKVWPLLPAAIYLLLFLLIVLSSLLILSFDIGSVTGFSLDPIKSVLAMDEFKKALINTVLFVLIGTPLELLIGFMLAMLLYQSDSRIKEILKGFFIIPLAIPGLVLATLLFIIFDSHGGFVNHILMGKYSFFPQIIDAPIAWRGTRFFSLALSLFGKIWRDMPISMLILFAGLNSLDTELFDAAKTMGATLKDRVQYIIIPLIMPAISTVLLLRSIEMWKEFIFPYVLAGRFHLLGTLIESLYINWNGQYEAESAVISLILVLCIVFGAFLIIVSVDFMRNLMVDGGVRLNGTD